jgi:hypothetical protein
LAALIRGLGSNAIGIFQPVFFGQVYPMYRLEYSMITAVAFTVFGMSSSILGGYLGNKLSKRT